jgi:hypothetical protein
MMKRIFILFSLVFFVGQAQSQSLPHPEREFRAAWIATVDNIDFPTKKKLSVEAAKSRVRGKS